MNFSSRVVQHFGVLPHEQILDFDSRRKTKSPLLSRGCVHLYCGLLSMLSSVLFGKWTDHVKGWKDTDLGDRIMYITYEEMVQVRHYPELSQALNVLSL